ncbi:MAG: hypothetical protein LAP39_13060 [Acidobacteriia bacterium]|nr:hypothetical protein [Terriglobia bacterium]
MIKVFVRVLGFLFAAVIVTAVGGFSYLYFRKPAMSPPLDVKLEITPARLARGKYLFTLADCDGCHSQGDFTRFDGPVAEDRRGMGFVFPPELGLPGAVAARKRRAGAQNREVNRVASATMGVGAPAFSGMSFLSVGKL